MVTRSRSRRRKNKFLEGELPMIEELRKVRMMTNVEKSKNHVSGSEPLLSIDDLHVWYELRRFGFGHAGYVKAVDGVSFELRAGETIAVVGESGCGKSSLMKTILGLYKPTQGRVIFDDKDLSQLDRQGMHWYHSP